MPVKTKKASTRVRGPLSDEGRAAISKAQKLRWKRFRAGNAAKPTKKASKQR